MTKKILPPDNTPYRRPFDEGLSIVRFVMVLFLVIWISASSYAIILQGRYEPLVGGGISLICLSPVWVMVWRGFR